jgi:hypothetical protein
MFSVPVDYVRRLHVVPVEVQEVELELQLLFLVEEEVVVELREE